MDRDRAEQIFSALEDQITQQLGYPRPSVTFRRAADLRSTGQAFELTVPAPNRKLDAPALEELKRLFEWSMKRTYGHAFRGNYANGDRHASRHRVGHAEGVQTSVRTNASQQRGEPPFGLLGRCRRARYAGLSRSALTGKRRAGPLMSRNTRAHGGAAELRGAARTCRQYRHRSRRGLGAIHVQKRR